MIEIPEKLSKDSFRFIKIRDGTKRPFESNWQETSNYKYNDPELTEHLQDGGNYGIVGGYGDLVIIDADKEKVEKAIEEKLPETFKVRSGGGGSHFYYLCEDLDKPIRLKSETYGDLGDVQGKGKQVVAPGSKHPSGSKYKIEKEKKIAEISESDIRRALRNFIESDKVSKEEEAKKLTSSYSSDQDIDLDLLDVVSTAGLDERSGEYQGSHPIHGSSTGNNFCVNPSKGVWFCFRHDSGGGALTWIAVKEGIISCSEARSGALDGDKFKEVLEVGREKYGLPEPEEKRDEAVEQIENIDVQDLQLRLHEQDKKLHKAQVLAEYLVENRQIVPVYLDSKMVNRTYYYYDPERAIWVETSENYILEFAKRHLASDYSSHFKREFLNQIRHHPSSIKYKNMGLPEKEVLTKDGKVYNLDTGSIRDIAKEDYALNMLNVQLTGEDKIDKFTELVEDTIPDEQERKTFQEYLGYCLRYPNHDYQKALLILGDTNTGKSTILKIAGKMFKYSETSSISLTQLGQKRAFHIMNMRNSILNIDEDMSSADISNSSVIKKIISGEKVPAEPKGEDIIEIEPKAKLMIASNVAPSPEVSNDPAFYDRFLTIEAPDTVPPEERDRELVDKLTTQKYLNGIFKWALKGLERLENNGGRFTKELDPMETRNKWDKYGNSVEKFIAECVEREKGNHIPTVDVYEYYEMWASDKMDEGLERSEFIRKAKEHSYMNKSRKQVKGTRRVCFTNINISVV